MRALPNLNAIRAFEAAARHGSFARAADELGVSHAAVSRHVRNLEAELGVALFQRHARHVVLTGEGSFFARTAADSLAALEVGSGRLRRGGSRSTVVLDVETDVGTRWLMPRLSAAGLEGLGVNLDLRIRPDPPRSVLGDVDLAITWGPVSCIGFKTAPLMDCETFPAAAPSLLEQGPEPGDPALYSSHRLIHERGLYWWRRYFEAMALDFDAAAGHLYFNRSHLCADAAVRGLGLVIGDVILFGDHLASGALLRLPGARLSSRDGYYLLTPDTRTLSGPVRQVRDWLVEQARETVGDA